MAGLSVLAQIPPDSKSHPAFSRAVRFLPRTTLLQAFLGCGFGCGSVAVLVTIRDMSQSQIITVVGEKCYMTSTGLYQLVAAEHLQ